MGKTTIVFSTILLLSIFGDPISATHIKRSLNEISKVGQQNHLEINSGKYLFNEDQEMMPCAKCWHRPCACIIQDAIDTDE
ncbi:uncharacterized protein MELLADRAFT_124464 [Melampsora larici-populina 98AG31]|uniref:Secreted protein n=1 Tax=Melampsora larici-populina (strain 98AG31 / pathotype 3-4-7) TaxID=747676 RepID=F4S1I3_MELLP|nr:uncharacterized protein MELLADRAFT_124463 [Melampsora larici-populina 98AG31]XP_007419778.1 uncharacterized protein MELLADRAFT_124464 [Melampsora larici-populina 98AG31]EGF96953.1 secreted protein [Melampsora larici-populina 98AG31]EGG01500.1 secreted protein [Melampsora larici-populina 98AG31]